MKKLLFILIVCCVTAGCGFISAGTWEDDDENWERAYNVQLPDSIDLVHSWYWRSPHFTLEQELFFEIKFNEAIKENYTGYSDIAKLDSSEYELIFYTQLLLIKPTSKPKNVVSLYIKI